MAPKLKSVFQKQQSRLALKAIAYGFFIALVALSGGGAFSVVLFFLAALFIYFNPPFNSARLFVSFIILTLAGPLAITELNPVVVGLAVLVFAALFYIILSLKDLAFLHREWWYFIMQLALFYVGFLLFFYHYPARPIIFMAIFYVAALFLFHERFYKESFALAALLSFLLTEAAWGISLLPLGFLNSAGALLVVAFVLEDMINSGRRNELSPRLILTDITIAVLSFLLIFGTTVWKV